MIGCSKKNWENSPRKCFWTKGKKPGLEFNIGLALCRAMNIWVSWLISSGSPSSARHTIQRYDEAILEWKYRLQSWNETKSEHQFCLLSILFSEFHQGNAEILPRAERHFENECFLSIKSHECGQVKEQAPRAFLALKNGLNIRELNNVFEV